MYQMTLNPMVNRKLHLDVAPSGFFRIEDTLQSQALSPLRNDLAFSASVLRSAGAAAADPISPHIGDRYRAIAEDIRFVLDLGYTRLKGLSDAQRKEDAALRMIMNETSRLLKTWCGEDTRHRFVRWIRPRHGCADISALAATDQMLELKGKLIGLASGGPHLPTTVGPHDDINTSLQKIDSALEAVSLAVSNFTHISQTLAFKDFIHRVTEFTIFNSFPVLGRLVRWSQTKLWTWITGSDDIAIRFLARAVMGHTAAVREDVAAARVRYNEWIEAYAATVKTSLEDELNLQGIGAGGQGLVDALRSILDAAQTIQRQRDREARMTRQYLRPLFKAGK
ncbi:hypothetical protein F5Y10DRAFT_247553 [Nemania abortiva]|nr:hypothetical protein F5Y10DRAFT_247553 [Nemania abortiva]